MKKPLIGLTVSQLTRSHNRKANLLLTDYGEAIRAAGGIPLLIPNEYPPENLAALRDVLHGILLTGGGDIDPSMYQSGPDEYAENIVEARDRVEKALVELAVKTDWPLLGICRGQQMLNAALGGALYTHIPQHCNTEIVHSQPESMPPGLLVHEVEILAASRLGNIIPSTRIMVNSRHHQAIKVLAQRLKPTAYAEDSIIEGVELPTHPFALGVQWHPESLPSDPYMNALFEGLVTATASG